MGNQNAVTESGKLKCLHCGAELEICEDWSIGKVVNKIRDFKVEHSDCSEKIKVIE